MKSKLIIALLAALAIPAYAADPAATPGVDKRQTNQSQRIEQGNTSGQLTQKESARLEKGQAKVQTAEDKAKADGTVTKKERQKLNKMQDKQSKRIYKEKHDGQHDRNHDGKKDRPHKK